MTALTTPEQIEGFRMLTLLQGLKLEVRGLRTSGRSCYQIIKAEFGLTGNRRQVLRLHTILRNLRQKHKMLLEERDGFLEALKHLGHNARVSGADMSLALDVASAAIAKAEGK